MARINIHLIWRLCGYSVLALVGATIVLLATQSLRLAPILSGADARPVETLSFIALAAVPVLGWAVAPAACLAVFAVAGQMAHDGEIVALLASGIGPRRLWPTLAGWLVALLSFAAVVALLAGPAAGRSLRELVLELSARAVVGSIRAGSFTAPAPGLSLRCESLGPKGELESIFFADDRNRKRHLQIAARSGSLRAVGSTGVLRLELSHGTAFLWSEEATPSTAISFDTLELNVPASEAVDARASFLPPLLVTSTAQLLGPRPKDVRPRDWGYALWRRLAGIAAVLVLGLASALLAWTTRPRPRFSGFLWATGLFVAYHLSARACEALMQAEHLGPRAAAGLPLLVPGLLALLVTVGQPRMKRKVYPHSPLE